MTSSELPPTCELTRAQHDGHACVWCRTLLTTGATSAGIARGQAGAHVLDVEVYACPACTSQIPAASLPVRPREGDEPGLVS